MNPSLGGHVGSFWSDRSRIEQPVPPFSSRSDFPLVDLYPALIRPLLFSGLNLDPEWLHQHTLSLFYWLQADAPEILRSWLWQRWDALYGYHHPRLQQTLWGQTFPNPVGLAAGFDKDGVATQVWPHLGFGFAEVGTVTLQAQSGNPRPRLFRLPQDRAALNRMGFNNQGAQALAQRLAQQRAVTGERAPCPLGVNLGKSKVTPLDAAAADYVGSFRWLQPWGDYFVVNVSSPNTPGLRSLQAREQLEPILAALQEENQGRKPLLIKIAPDLADADILDVVGLVQRYRLAGIIATNTTISRDGLQTRRLQATGRSIEAEAGGISGAPLRSRSTEVIHLIYQHTGAQVPIIGVGGIFSAEDAWEKVTAGASLVQLYTGWIYEGPGLVKHILAGLVEKLDQQGFAHLSDAVGSAHSIG
jgi:dihydroorotate dehydrogenase